MPSSRCGRSATMLAESRPTPNLVFVASLSRGLSSRLKPSRAVLRLAWFIEPVLSARVSLRLSANLPFVPRRPAALLIAAYCGLHLKLLLRTLRSGNDEEPRGFAHWSLCSADARSTGALEARRAVAPSREVQYGRRRRRRAEARPRGRHAQDRTASASKPSFRSRVAWRHRCDVSTHRS